MRVGNRDHGRPDRSDTGSAIEPYKRGRRRAGRRGPTGRWPAAAGQPRRAHVRLAGASNTRRDRTHPADHSGRTRPDSSG
jgi:hypothetical protein